MDNNYGQNTFPNGEQLEKPMSMGEWLLTLIVLALPCVGFVMLFVWGFGQGNTNRKNFCRAYLIIFAIGIVLGIIFYSILGVAMFRTFNALQ